MGVAAMVLGIAAAYFGGCMFWTVWGGFVGCGCGIVAIILGLIARNKSDLSQAQHKMGMVGLVLGIVGAVVGLGLGIVFIFVWKQAGPEIYDIYNYIS